MSFDVRNIVTGGKGRGEIVEPVKELEQAKA